MIDWNSPIEAVNRDGRTVTASFQASDKSGQHNCLVGSFGSFAFHYDGSRYFMHDGLDGWTIRNTEPTTTIPTALYDRVAGLVRAAADVGCPDTWAQCHEALSGIRDAAREIAKELPVEVDADLIEARKLCAELYNPQWANEEWPLKENDFLKAITKALTRGRQLERGE